MKKYIILFLCIFSLAAAGCEVIQGEIDQLKSEVEELRQADADMLAQIETLNKNVSNIQIIISAIQSGAYIKSVMPLMEDNEQVGYIFTLSSGEIFKVRDGKNGKDGSVPAIGIGNDGTGNYWWTLDGKPLLDADGNKINASGIVPQFKIVDGYWNISYDNGQSWMQLGKADGIDGEDGLDGDQLFSGIEYYEGSNTVKFILADNTVLTLPCYQAISISFNVPDNQAGISAGETIKVNYTLSYGDDRTVVTASTDGNYIAEVIKSSNVSGTILITCPGLYMDGYVNVMAFDGVGYSAVGVIHFFEKALIFDRSLEYSVGTDEGTITVPFLYNFEYYVEVDPVSSSWITLDQTKVGFESGVIKAHYSQNNGSQRKGYINIYPTNTAGNAFARIAITQSAAYFSIGRQSLVFSSDGGKEEIDVSTSRSVYLDVSNDWISAEMVTRSSHNYSLNVTAASNTTGQKRAGKIVLRAEDDWSTLASIDVVQMAKGGDDAMDLVFEVRVNEANDYTAYLPVGNMYYDHDFIIDWGDGSYQRVNSEYDKQYCLHEYESSPGPRNYDVRISGRVVRISSEPINEGKRSAIVAIKQWGNVGLRYMDNAFRGNTSLERVAADDSYCFSDVENFNGTFESCPRLKTLPEGLFKYAKTAWNFNSTFRECRSLETVPAALFSGCISNQTFDETFYGCKSLKTLASDMFSGCTKVQTFRNTFGECKLIETIPAGLFDSAVSATAFDSTFGGCSKIASIPDGLFKYAVKVNNFNSTFRNIAIKRIPERLFHYCPDVTSFDCTFDACHQLEFIPTGLFDNNRKVVNFNRTFGWCYYIKGESPYTVIGGKKVHLYERVDYPDYFVTPITSEYCFAENWGMTDYENMPTSWRNN